MNFENTDYTTPENNEELVQSPVFDEPATPVFVSPEEVQAEFAAQNNAGTELAGLAYEIIEDDAEAARTAVPLKLETEEKDSFREDTNQRESTSRAAQQEDTPPQLAGGDAGGRRPPDVTLGSPGADDEDNEPERLDDDGPEQRATLYINEALPPIDDASEGLRRQQDLTRTIKQLGERVAAETVVTDGDAFSAIWSDMPTPDKVKASVSEGAYHYLRGQEHDGWREHRLEDGSTLLVNGEIEVRQGLGRERQAHDDLMSRCWETKSGILVASPSDVFAAKSWSELPEDQAVLAAARQRLKDPERPLPKEVIKHEIDIVRECAPEELRDHPDVQPGIEMGANGLAIVNMYGDGRIGSVNQIVGDLEKPAYNVPATYHNGHDVPHDMQVLGQHMLDVNAADREAGREETFRPEDFGLAMAAEGYSDANYGDGRKKDQPEDAPPDSHDEGRSGDLAEAHALHRGFEPSKARRLGNIVKDTTFTEGTGEQRGADSPDPLSQSVCAVDLEGASTRRNLEDGWNLITEDGHSARWSKNRTLGKVAADHNVIIRSADETAELVDEYPDTPPSDDPHGETPRQYVVNRLKGQITFVGHGYRYPSIWRYENRRIRRENADEYSRLVREMSDPNRPLSARQALEQSREYASRED